MSDTTAHDEIKIESRDESNLAEQVEGILELQSAESLNILSYLLPSLLLARSTSRQPPVNRPFLHPLNFNAGGPHGPIVLSRSSSKELRLSFF